MKTIYLNKTKHEFEKQNLVTISEGRKRYDILKCKNCGIQGKTYSLGILNVKSSYSKKKIEHCVYAPISSDEYVGKEIKITLCAATGRVFENITPSSVHTVIVPPDDYKNDDSGVWVMGNGEPVKVLSNEFEYRTQ